MQPEDIKKLISVTRCPRSSEDLALVENKGLCSSSGHYAYPLIGGIPWLMPWPDSALAEWRNKALQYRNSVESEIRECRAALAKKTTLSGTRTRLTAWMKGREDHLNVFMQLLGEVLGARVQGHTGVAEALWGRQPVQQQLVSYDQTIFRDWVWGGEETGETMKLLKKVIPAELNWGCTLFAGAGACGIPVRLHQDYNISYSVACDINPWLFQVARKMIEGKSLRLTEFPHPLKPGEEPCMTHCLRLPEKPVRNFVQVLADFLRSPFRTEAFDTLCTPWFIDIIQKDLSVIFKIINSLTKPGGHWLNFGPYLFDHCHVSERFTPDEVLHYAKKAGFEILSTNQDYIPYVNSPHSTHARSEMIHTFLAKKVKSVTPPAAPQTHLPEWLVDHEIPVPLRPFFRDFGASQQVYCDIIALIDNQRTVNDLCVALGDKFHTSPEQMKPSLVNFLTSMAEEQKSFLFRGLS